MTTVSKYSLLYRLRDIVAHAINGENKQLAYWTWQHHCEQQQHQHSLPSFWTRTVRQKYAKLTILGGKLFHTLVMRSQKKLFCTLIRQWFMNSLYGCSCMTCTTVFWPVLLLSNAIPYMTMLHFLFLICPFVVYCHQSTVKHAFQNTQNNCYQWLSNSCRMHQIRLRPVSTLVASSNEDGHRSTGLVEVIVPVALAIFASTPLFLFMMTNREWLLSVGKASILL